MANLQERDIANIVRKTLLECWAREPSRVARNPQDLFHSDAVRAIKAEMVDAGRKLWHRQYVDGNGGNISARLTRDYVLCTPTLCSKGDLRIEDMSLVDFENNQICGDCPQTSEIKLHLAIYRTVPHANAVIHCHPPYTTAHAIAGVIPQTNLVPEEEVFVGPVALAPYETPGSVEFAQTVVPFARQHNTILLANHGVVCWADTITHAEWFVEVIETFCKTRMIALQLRSPLPEIPPHKIEELLSIKFSLGLPDARLPLQDIAGTEPLGLFGNQNSSFDISSDSSHWRTLGDEPDLESLVSLITAHIRVAMEERSETVS